MCYDDKNLKLLINKISSQLAANDISNKDRAAIVLPNGPHMATSFLAISSYMSAAPLNPNYKAEEFEFYLGDLKPKILIVEPNVDELPLEIKDNANLVSVKEAIINSDEAWDPGVFKKELSSIKVKTEGKLMGISRNPYHFSSSNVEHYAIGFLYGPYSKLPQNG